MKSKLQWLQQGTKSNGPQAIYKNEAKSKSFLVILIVSPLPALLIIFFLLVIKKVLVKLFWTLIGVIEVFGTLILACLAQDVFMFLKVRNDFWKRVKSWNLESRGKIILLRWSVTIVCLLTAFLGKLRRRNMISAAFLYFNCSYLSGLVWSAWWGNKGGLGFSSGGWVGETFRRLELTCSSPTTPCPGVAWLYQERDSLRIALCRKSCEIKCQNVRRIN